MDNFVLLAFSLPIAASGDEALLAVGKGQIPNDTGSDGATKMSLVDSSAPGVKVLKVVYADGDSFGDRVAKVANWKPFDALQFRALNPSKQTVRLTLTVKHKGTTNYQTRIDVPVVLKPGKNDVKIDVQKLRNVNGSMPDLTAVGRWYLACQGGTAPTLFFGDIKLTGGKSSSGDSTDATPAGPPGGAASDKIQTDPARLARIRAAKMPKITRPVEFNTPEADAILSALEVFPPDNPWNQVVAEWPLHPNSDAMIASIGRDKPLRYNPDMAFVLVPPNQRRVPVKITAYPGESDKGPFPVPGNMPIEGWPGHSPKLSLDDVQRDKLNQGGDRHGIVVDPVKRILYEFYTAKKTNAGWEASQASIFDLKSNKLRPDGWTSADAAGLPIFPAVVRYDELKRGEIEHAMRVTIRKSRRAYVAPATHYASRHTNKDYPRMGERIRLKQDYDISGFSPEVQTILKGLKKYGMFVADNGIEWAISVAPDPRIPVLHAELRRVKGSAFEVVVPPK